MSLLQEAEHGASIGAARAALAEAYLRTGNYDAVEEILERTLASARRIGNRRDEADAIAVQGMTLHFRAIDLPPEERAAIDPTPEQELFERAYAMRREIDDSEGIAESLFQLGLVQQVLRRDLVAGAPYVEEALAVVETVPDADVLLRSEIHRHVGFDLLLRQERPDDARRRLRTSLDLRAVLDERGWRASAHIALALCERIAGRREEALEHSRQALEVSRSERLRGRFVTAASDALREAQKLPDQSTP